MGVVAIDHVQLAMPEGGEAEARRFYGDLLGLREVPKPPELARRGGAWFEAGAVKLHLGVEADFRPARKAHPALLVDGLPALVERLTSAGCRVQAADGVPGHERVHVSDPFGNRVELMERTEPLGGAGPSSSGFD
jgi:catechol 2,3-dioxygenase-like lactoylglutathione lyase family enzyme